VAAVAVGDIYKLNFNFKVLWKSSGFRNDYGHEIYFADIDGDGNEEILLCTVDGINHEYDCKNNVGDFLILNNDGTVLLRKRVDDFIENDNHFDDIAVADFLNNGTYQILFEKGILIDTSGNVLWDIQEYMHHGQWIAYANNHDKSGTICFISELWEPKVRGLFFTGQGEKIIDINGMYPKEASDEITKLQTRCHFFQNEFFVAEQAFSPGHAYTDLNKREYYAKCLFIDLSGTVSGELPYEDALIPGYYYNGEVHSKIADVDNDGYLEVVYPKQNGNVMIIKKKH